MTVRGVSSNPASPLYNASAPALSGSAGALATVLDAVLVNGFSGFTALGWTIAYTGTNQRQYAMGAGGTGCQLYLNDTGPGAGGAREARITGFKTGTALGTGTGQFPTTTQMTTPSGALVVRKSTTADATARYYTIVGDSHTFYMFVETGDQNGPVIAFMWSFGDFFSYSSTDTSNCVIMARVAENTGAMGPAANPSSFGSAYDHLSALTAINSTGLTNTLNGHYIAANYTNVGGSIPFGKHSDGAKMGSTGYSGYQVGYLGAWTNGSNNVGTTWTSEFSYPNAPDGGLYVAPIWIHHNGFVRGYLKGLWCPLQHLPLGHNDTYSATGNLSGKSMVSQNIIGASTVFSGTNAPVITSCQIHIEYSDTWS